ncbi:putative DNA-directed RNA polymerase [Bienertia sinuspersici]
MGEKTNLISSPTGDKEDIYTCFQEELLSYLAKAYEKSGNEDIFDSIKGIFSRSFVKRIFMPMIYGKTPMSTCDDIRNDLKQFIKGSACMKLTNLCYEFWKCKYSHMNGFINLIKIIGWMNSMCDRPVYYRTPTDSMDHSKMMDSYHIWVYDRQLRKKRRVSLRIPSERRDRRKSHVSTFVNFIHQKDAFLAMRVVEYLMSIGGPIYTVHDNFISNAYCSSFLPQIYLSVLKGMGPPLKVVNTFLLENLCSGLTQEDLKTGGLNIDIRYNTQFVLPEKDLDKILKVKKREN